MSPHNKMLFKDRQIRTLYWTVSSAAWFLILFGIGMAALWLSGSVWPEKILPGFYYMKFNTSLAFLACGIGLIAVLRESRIMVRITGVFILLIGGLTLAQYITGLNIGIDQLLLKDFYYPENPYPGRMAPSPSLALTCAGLSLLLMASSNIWRRPIFIVIVELLGFLIFALGAEGLIGHIQHIAYAYSWGSYARMAPQAAICFMAYGIGLLSLAWYRQDTHITRFPLWFPAMLCFLVLMIDISTPRGIATGIIYIPLVFCSLWFPRPHTTFVFALIATILSVLSIFAKPFSDVEMWVIATNRAITIGAIWFVAALVYLRRNSEIAFKQSESRLRAVVNKVLDALISINPRGIIEHVNPACERIFGYQADELIGKNIKILMPEPYHSEHDGYLSHYLSTGETRILGTAGREVSGKRKDGSVFPIDLSVSSYELEDGKRFLGLIRDITKRKEDEEKLFQYTEDLERSNQELDDFAYIASHDLKEPLRGLFNNAKFLEQDYKDKLDAEGVARLQRLGYLSQRMETLVNDLLYFSRLGRQELAIQSTDLNEVVQDISTLMEATLKERNVSILIQTPLPSIIGDKTRITELFRNLITNAAKYNNKPKKTIEIGCLDEVKTKNGKERQVFYVRDNGIGIEPEFHEEIFRIFKRLNEEDDDKKGTGVGLTFVRKIIERHNGRIWLESMPGQGTTFYFTLKQGAANVSASTTSHNSACRR